MTRDKTKTFGDFSDVGIPGTVKSLFGKGRHGQNLVECTKPFEDLDAMNYVIRSIPRAKLSFNFNDMKCNKNFPKNKIFNSQA